MRTKIKVHGLPDLSSLVGTESTIDWPGETISDMIAWLAKQHGPQIQESLLNDQGCIDAAIQVMVNTQGFVPRDQIASHTLGEGDTVTFVLLVGGG